MWYTLFKIGTLTWLLEWAIPGQGICCQEFHDRAKAQAFLLEIKSSLREG